MGNNPAGGTGWVGELARRTRVQRDHQGIKTAGTQGVFTDGSQEEQRVEEVGRSSEQWK